MDYLKQDLDKFPSTFVIDTTNLNKDRVSSTIQKLNDDRENTVKLEAESINITNFLSYLHFLLKEDQQALDLVEESLVKDPENIIAYTNKARILLEHEEISEVENILTKLHALEKRQDYDRRKCSAEADLAYAYSRIGPWYQQKAIEIYERVVHQYPSEYSWKFGFGMTLMRRTHIFISQADNKFDSKQQETLTVHAAELLHDVATKSDEPLLRAQAYAMLGKILFNISKCLYKNIPHTIKLLNYKTCLENAVKEFPEDPWVLQICGQYARYSGELDRSEELLRLAIQIHPTCQGYHHLALTLKRKVEKCGHRKDNLKLGASKTGRGSYGDRQRKTEDTRYIYIGKFRTVGRFQGKKKEHNLRAMINSPLKVQVVPENELLLEAIHLLEKTEQLDPYALTIQYDKGIIYRMLGQVEEAVKVFKRLLSKKNFFSTETQFTNVYEQLGLCLLEMSESDEVLPSVKEKLQKDGYCHLSHALQLQSQIVANDQQFKKVWNSYATLQELLSCDSDRMPKQLAVLHMLMGDHKDAIDIYREIFRTEKDRMEPEDCTNMLDCYLRQKQIEECVTLLSSWECTAVFPRLPPSLIFDVYIDGAFHAYTTDKTQLAYNRFRKAFRVYGMFENAAYQEKDVLILHSCAEEMACKLPENIYGILEDFVGLHCTINTNDLIRQGPVSTRCPIIPDASCVIIIIHDSAEGNDNRFVKQALEMSSRKAGPKVVIVSDDKSNVPDAVKSKPFIQIPPPLEDVRYLDDKIPEKYEEWIKTFVYLLKPN
ncbi:uncharacterized protein LOC132549456 [Ylistrum balloti]|uniref:uncharacterized protein LOC132549456 n=1 Tax=Ylistrum balloti TaxID=509963 RepID=UPI002905AD38|nr:uncharacterized protein LOC132549456 [Ylistrum balloti]